VPSGPGPWSRPHTPGSSITLGSRHPRVAIGEGEKAEGAWSGERVLVVDGTPAFELSFWCGTCQLLFKRLEGSTATLSVEQLCEDLNDGLDDVSSAVLEVFGPLLQEGSYLPLSLDVTPTLVRPGDGIDYFSHEQIATWGVEGFWGLPVYPRTPYYRTFSTAVSPAEHLYEFIVPMVPPSWNDESRVQEYVEALHAGSRPTAVAFSILDVCAPAAATHSTDHYTHWGLTHVLLDGHHKMAAAAAAGASLRLLSLLSVDRSLATVEQVLRIPRLRAGEPASR
jgi:hypothetical protein